jgi:polyisoprenoid-binding protein YceI
MTITPTTAILAGTWNIDAAHSGAGFSVRHLMSKVRGSFSDVSGQITTAENILDSTVSVRIATASITTNNEQRDAHLRSADFFDEELGGELTFVSTGIRESDGSYVISGDLTINGVTRPVDLEAEFLGIEPDAFGNVRLGAEARTSINRKDFNVNWNLPLDGGKYLVGDKVEITLAVEAVQA